MKKISVVVLLMIFLIGCNKSTELFADADSAVTAVNSITPVFSGTIEKAEINYLIHDSLYDEIKENPIIWSAYFEGKYDIKIKLNYINMKDIEYVFDKNLDGIIYLGSNYNKEIYQLIENDSLYDISSYFDKYDWRQIIDSNYIIPVTKGEKIFAVPAISNPTLMPRYYNKEYLERLNLSVPATIDEFTDYVMAAKNLNPDFYPLIFDNFSANKCTADLFRSFNVYLNAHVGSAVCYNPKTGSLEDGVYSANFDLALSYIRMLQDNGYLKVFQHLNNELPDELSVASEFNQTYFKGMTWSNRKPKYKYLTSYFLEGINTEKLVEVKKDIDFYVLPVFSEKADFLMETFNKVFIDKQYYSDLKYGMEGIDYIYNSDKVVTINDFRGIPQLLQLDYSANEIKTMDIISNFSSSIIYETSNYYDLLSFSKLLTFTEQLRFSQFVSDSSPQILMDIFNIEIPMADSIAAYKMQFNRQHMKTFIDELNEKLGTTTNYNY